jgi:hypothetical protein
MLGRVMGDAARKSFVDRSDVNGLDRALSQMIKAGWIHEIGKRRVPR